MRFPKLFEPLRIGGVLVRNRVAMAPMVNLYCDRGFVTDQQIAYYAARARGGVGLIITEATFTSQWANENSPLPILGLYDPAQMPGLGDLVEAIHAFGAKTFIQLNPGPGVQGSSLGSGVRPVGPSAVSYRIPPAMVPRNFVGPELSRWMAGEVAREMTVEEIEREQESFVRAALMAKQVGFDGLEIHAAHGFLLHEFLSPRFNHRTDRYGGSLENRMRFLLEIVRKTRAAVGADMAIGVRTSVDEHVPGGLTCDDTRRVVARLEQEGIDYYHVGDGTFETLKYTIPDEDASMLEGGRDLKKLVGLPILTPSIHDPETAERAIREGATDAIALGRQLIVDPDWANKVKRNRVADIRRCDRCNRGCFVRIFRGLRVKCVLNPESGLERHNPQYAAWSLRRKAIHKRIGRDVVRSKPDRRARAGAAGR